MVMRGGWLLLLRFFLGRTAATEEEEEGMGGGGGVGGRGWEERMVPEAWWSRACLSWACVIGWVGGWVGGWVDGSVGRGDVGGGVVVLLAWVWVRRGPALCACRWVDGSVGRGDGSGGVVVLLAWVWVGGTRAGAVCVWVWVGGSKRRQGCVRQFWLGLGLGGELLNALPPTKTRAGGGGSNGCAATAKEAMGQALRAGVCCGWEEEKEKGQTRLNAHFGPPRREFRCNKTVKLSLAWVGSGGAPTRTHTFAPSPLFGTCTLSRCPARQKPMGPPPRPRPGH